MVVENKISISKNHDLLTLIDDRNPAKTEKVDGRRVRRKGEAYERKAGHRQAKQSHTCVEI